MKTIKLTNIDVASLKSLFARSLVVTEKTLYFEIHSDKITSFVSNTQDHFSKTWETASKGIFESAEQFDTLKIFFLRGDIFSNKILGFFNKANWELTVNEKGYVNQIKMTEGSLEFTIQTSDIEVFTTILPQEEQDKRFSLADKVASFELQTGTVANIISMAGIADFSQNQTDYVVLTGEAGKVRISNNMFDKEVGAFEGADFSQKLYKGFLSLLDKEDMTIHVCVPETEDRTPMLVFENKHAEISSKSSAVLMTDESVDAYDIDDTDLIGW